MYLSEKISRLRFSTNGVVLSSVTKKYSEDECSERCDSYQSELPDRQCEVIGKILS
jgi:hypothetical protein